MAGVYDTVDELVAAVAKETGVASGDVRKVLRASFASTRAYIEREMSKELSDEDLDKVSGGIGAAAAAQGFAAPKIPNVRKLIASVPSADV